MAEVKKNSTINIKRRIGTTVENLYNKLFNGYVYNMSLDVGYNGAATVLTLNLALNRTLNQVKLNTDIISDRKRDIRRVKGLVASQKLAPSNSTGNIGTSGVGASLGAQNEISKIADKDFNIDPNYIGINCSYDVGIYNPNGSSSYEFTNFKIVSFSISKKNDQKILNLVLKDNSFVLDKIYVGLLGQEIALDERSENDALVSNIKISCPQIGTQCAAGQVTLNQLRQTLHFSNNKFKNNFFSKLKTSGNANFSNVNIISGEVLEENKSNYILISSKDKNKTIYKGYGAVIILGEEEFKDAPCNAAEVSYSFETLLRAIKALGISISQNPKPSNASTTTNYDSIKDKSNGKLKKQYKGTLRQVLNQWCEDYAYSYCIDFSNSSLDSFTIKGIDLSSSFSKESVLGVKLDLENLESSSSNSSFVVKSEDLSYDLSQQKLKVYSSSYFKEAKQKTISYENNLGYKSFKNIDIFKEYSGVFGNGTTIRDFSGSFRTKAQILTSAILGKHSPRLREIYNYSIGAFPALGFIPFYGNPNGAKINLSNNKDLLFSESISQVLEIASQNLFSEDGSPCYNLDLGFFNEELAKTVFDFEMFIADSIGRYYWTDVIESLDGEYGNEDFYGKYELVSSANVQKVLVGQIYQLDFFKKARYLLQSLSAIYSSGTAQYYNAFRVLSETAANINTVCRAAQESFDQLQGNLNNFKKFRFFHERTSAAYGVYQDFIEDISNLTFSIAGSTTAAPEKIDLTEIYSPVFKELSPVSLAMLQAALPININNVALGSFKFGVLVGVNNQRQIYSIQTPNIFVGGVSNPIEIQNSIYSRCEKILNINSSGRPSTLALNKKTCNKTLLYETCVKPCELAENDIGIDNAVSFAAGPDPYSCFGITIRRFNNKFLDNFVLGQVFRSSTINGNLSLEALVNKPNEVLIQTLRSATKIPYLTFKTTNQYESIIAPSQNNYLIDLISKTTSETFLPFRNYVMGGLESPEDLYKILNNENFSVDLNINNITPNVRELFGDETSPSFITAPVDLTKVANYPVFIEYQGYNGDDPNYQFTTFSAFHNALKTYYDSTNASSSQPNLKFAAEIFCSEIPSDLKEILSVNNGLAQLNINLAENGLNISCSFESSPAAPSNLESLILKNKPNIKLVNTNYFQ